MVKIIEIDSKYTFDDMGVKCKDRPDHICFTRSGAKITKISSPYFRDLFYVRGYNDRMTIGWQEYLYRQNMQGSTSHPDNEAAYLMGYADADGDWRGIS